MREADPMIPPRTVGRIVGWLGACLIFGLGFWLILPEGWGPVSIVILAVICGTLLCPPPLERGR
jgi:hypothetical protein